MYDIRNVPKVVEYKGEDREWESGGGADAGNTGEIPARETLQSLESRDVTTVTDQTTGPA